MSASITASDNPPVTKLVCPLDTTDLIELVVRFVELVNEHVDQIDLYDYQRGFLRRIIGSLIEKDGAVITGLWSRQSGKSEAIASIGMPLCIFLPSLARAFPDDPRLRDYLNGFWIGIFAPRQQQSSIIYERIRRRANKEAMREFYADPDISTWLVTSRGDQVAWANGSFIVSQTASEQSNVEGKTFHLVIMDEAQLISRSKAEKEIMPMLTSTNGSCVKIGTVSYSRGGYHDSIVYNVAFEQRTGVRNHFEFPYDVVIRQKREAFERTGNPFHLNYEKWVNSYLERLGGNMENPEFRMNFRLIWSQSYSFAISPESFEASADESLEIGDYIPWFENYAGIDWGKKTDSSVTTIVQRGQEVPEIIKVDVAPGGEQPKLYQKRFVAWLETQGRWEEQLATIVDFLQLFAVRGVCADATGMGDPNTERLATLLPEVTVMPIVFSAQMNDRLYKRYRGDWENNRIIFPYGPETVESEVFTRFRNQHMQLEKRKVNGLLRCEAPEGEHDDYPDSGALGCYAADVCRPVNDGVITVISNPMYTDSRLAKWSGQATASTRHDRYRR